MNNNEFLTTSLSLAAAIQLASNSKLKTVRRDSSSTRATFAFEETDELHEVIELFWQKTLKVDALSYFETLKFIKSRLYEERGSA